MPFYTRGNVRIRYEEAGSGFPLFIIYGGGLNSKVTYPNGPFDAVAEFKSEYRCITHGPAQRERRPVHRSARFRAALGRAHR